MTDDLAARIDRLESLAEIQQLPIRYALAVDGRDLDAWVNLFVVDVSAHWKTKMKAIGAFKSQFFDPKSKEPKTNCQCAHSSVPGSERSWPITLAIP